MAHQASVDEKKQAASHLAIMYSLIDDFSVRSLGEL